MTSSSVQFFSSRRVQLVGLPQPIINNPQALVHNPAIERSDRVFKQRRVSRNLFGSPKPGEVKELLQKETTEKRSYILQRYNFDIFCPPNVESSQPQSKYACKLQHSDVHERDNHEYDCHLNRNDTSSNFTSQKINLKTNITNTDLRASKESLEADNILPAPYINGKERDKLNGRQTLITDCFSLRKRNISGVNKNVYESVKCCPLKEEISSVPSSSTALKNSVIEIMKDRSESQV